MAAVAIYNSKGGVGKTTMAINLAWEAVQKGFRTLLWEVDGQGDSSSILAIGGKPPKINATSLMLGMSQLRDQIRPTRVAGLNIMSADCDVRRTENFFITYSRQNRFGRLLDELNEEYDVIIFDCAPSFDGTVRKILLAADLVIAPVIPGMLSLQGLTRVRQFMTRKRGTHPPILPVFSMVDLRRRSHKQAIIKHGDWPVIPMSTKISEASLKESLGSGLVFRLEQADPFETLWSGIEQKLWAIKVLRTKPGKNQDDSALIESDNKIPAPSV